MNTEQVSIKRRRLDIAGVAALSTTDPIFDTLRQQLDGQSMGEILEKANKGDTCAQWWIGNIYKKGIGVEINERKALEWYMKSAMGGDIMGMSECAVFLYYEKGGSVKDHYQAVAIWKSIASVPHAVEAQYHLALAYWDGFGIAKNKPEAIKWMRQAADRNDERARIWLCGMDPINYQIDSVLASLKNPISPSVMKMLGDFFMRHDLLVPLNETKAIEWYQHAAENSVDAMYELYAFYVNSTEECYDLDGTALRWITTAAMRGFPQAQCSLGYAYEHGEIGLKQNSEAAMYWYEKSADQGYSDARYYLARMLDDREEWLQAFHLFQLAATQHHYDAMYHLSAMYRMGDGCAPNRQKANEWCIKAALYGSLDAKGAILQFVHNNEENMRLALRDIKEAAEWTRV